MMMSVGIKINIRFRMYKNISAHLKIYCLVVFNSLDNNLKLFNKTPGLSNV